MDPITTTAIIGAGASLIGQAGNYFAEKKSAETAYERQKELMEQQNEYNSIENQVERMKRAGLNAAAVLSNGNPSTSGSNAPSVQKSNPRIDLSSLATIGPALAQMKLDQAQADYWQTQADKEKPYAEYAGILLQNQILKDSNDITYGLKNLENLEQRNQQLNIENDILSINREFSRDDWNFRFQKYQSDLMYQQQQILDLQYQNEFTNQAEYQELCARAYNNWASGALAYAQKDLVNAGVAEKQINAQLLSEAYRHALVMNGITEKHENARQVMGLVGQGVDIATDVVDGVMSVVNPFKGFAMSKQQSRDKMDMFNAELQRKVAKDAQDYYLKQQGKQTLTTYGEGKKLEVTQQIP